MINLGMMYKCPSCLRDIPGADLIVSKNRESEIAFCPYCKFVVVAASDDPEQDVKKVMEDA